AAREDFAPSIVNDGPLLVHDIIIFQKLFADIEVVRLDPLLRVLNGAADHPVLDRNPFFHAEPAHQVRDPVRAEDSKKVILEREIKPGGAGISLPSGTAAQLIIDPPRFVPLRPDNVKPA